MPITVKPAPMIRPLKWSSEASRPGCQVRGCENPAKWSIEWPRRLPRELDEWTTAGGYRCNVHGREWAERNDLAYPPKEEEG